MKSNVTSFEALSLDKQPDGLIPVIIQDNDTLEVLMLGYMNAEAFEKSLAEGRVTFYSRTRQTLWTKGETSGNFLNIVEMRDDCDHDTLLIRVNPIGPTCHTGARSCFRQDGDTNEGFIRHLGAFIKTRHEQMPEGSYTTKLFNKGVPKIAQKVGEEAVETVIEAVAGNYDDMIYEASDLIYHLLVLLESTGKSIADLETELVKRHS
ncbi:MAG: bifunctional phosphoribosyl-AMP cyclohydrolase/phosphoribosyl-ATP diphosphatase HisIE [Rikenellaceae bacterium]